MQQPMPQQQKNQQQMQPQMQQQQMMQQNMQPQQLEQLQQQRLAAAVAAQTQRISNFQTSVPSGAAAAGQMKGGPQMPMANMWPQDPNQWQWPQQGKGQNASN